MEDDQFLELIRGINEAKVLIATNASTLDAVHERQNNVLSRMLALEAHASKVTAIVEEQNILPRVVSLEGSRFRWTGMVAIMMILLTISGFFFSGPIKEIVNVPITAEMNTEAHNKLDQKVDSNDRNINNRVDVIQNRFDKLDGRVNDLKTKVDNMYPRTSEQ